MHKLTFFAVSSLLVLFALAIMGTSLMNSLVKDVDRVVEENNVLGQEAQNSQTIELDYGEQKYKISWFIADVSKLKLIPNFSQKNQANEIVSDNNCQYAINAGFYDENDLPLGLFISEGETLHNFRSNRIMNAVLSINRFDTPRITREIPEDPLVSAVQTGPILIENDNPLEVVISTDKAARRSIAFVTGENELYFLSIYSALSGFRGPFMHQLPELLTEFEQRLNINIADAVNLDGGSASYFKSSELTLTEISPIGALFCVQ